MKQETVTIRCCGELMKNAEKYFKTIGIDYTCIILKDNVDYEFVFSKKEFNFLKLTWNHSEYGIFRNCEGFLLAQKI